MLRITILSVAVTIFPWIVAAQPPTAEAQTAQQFFAKGRELFQQRHYDEAAEAYEKAIDIDPSISAAYVGLGAAFMNMNRNADAVEPLKKAIVIDAKNGVAYRDLGLAYIKLRRYPDAKSVLMDAIHAGLADATVYEYLGLVASETGRAAESLDNFQKAIELAPENVEINHNLGLTYSRLGRYADGIPYFVKAIRLNPAYEKAYYELGVAQTHTGRYSEAVDTFTKYIEITRDARGLEERSWAYLYMGSGKEAAKDAKQLLDNFGWKIQRSMYWALLAIMGYKSAGSEAEAHSIIEEFQKNSRPEQWPSKAIKFFAGQMTADELLQAAADNDDKTEAQAYIGFELRVLGQPQEARKHFIWVRDFGNKGYFEYNLAIAELTRLPN